MLRFNTSRVIISTLVIASCSLLELRGVKTTRVAVRELKDSGLFEVLDLRVCLKSSVKKVRQYLENENTQHVAFCFVITELWSCNTRSNVALIVR